MKKRLLSLILCALIAGLPLLSCSEAPAAENGDTPSGADTAGLSADTAAEETETPETERPKAEDTLTIKSFEGRDYRMISTNQDSRHVDILAEEMTGATLNDRVYLRNEKVSSLYNVKMTAEEMDFGTINNMIKADAAAGDVSYELYLTNYTAHSMGSGGFLYNFYDLPAVDLTKEWWDQSEVADMTIQGKLYLAIGDISPTELLTSECMLFNKRLVDDNGMAYPYEEALAGTWTLDKYLALADGKTTDLNGDGAIKVDDDLFSLTCWSDYPTAMLYGAGGDFSEFDGEGNAVLNINTEKSVDIYNKIYAALIGTNGNYETERSCCSVS